MAVAGKIDFPAYMKDWHSDWLGNHSAGCLTVSESMCHALENNPFSGEEAFNPQNATILDPNGSGTNMSLLHAIGVVLIQFYEEVGDIEPVTKWNSYIDAIGYSQSDIAAINPVGLWNSFITETGYDPNAFDPVSKWNEFKNELGYDPDSINPIDLWNSYLTNLGYDPETVDPVQSWKNMVDESSYNHEGIAEYNALMTDQLESQALPAYRAGMRNIGAVMTSAFSIGESIMRAFKDRDVGQHASQLAREGVQVMTQLQNQKNNLLHDINKTGAVSMAQLEQGKQSFKHEYQKESILSMNQMQTQKLELAHQFQKEGISIMNQMEQAKIKLAHEFYRESLQALMQFYANRLNTYKAFVAAWIEGVRMYIVALKEEADTNLSIKESEAKWRLEVYQYGGNLLASVSGAPSVGGPNKSVSSGRSALAGALSGAALGGAVASGLGLSEGWGALAGAAGGAAMSFI